MAGVELALRDHARYFRYFNYQVELVVGAGHQWRKDIPLKTIKYLSPRFRPIYTARLKLDRGIVPNDFPLLVKKIKDELRQHIVASDINVVIAHNVMTRHYNLPLTAALAELAAEMSDIQFITWVHDASFSDNGYIDLPQKLQKKYPWSLLANPAPNFQYVAISETRASELKAIFKVEFPLQVIPNSIDPKKFFKLQPQVRELVNELKLHELDYVGVLPVRAVARKNIEYAIRVIAAMKAAGYKVKFLITAPLNYQKLGAQTYLNGLIKLVAELKLTDEVVFLSKYRLKNGKPFDLLKLAVVDLYDIADFLLIPSTIEGFGMPLIEAALSRAAIFASDIPPFREVGNNELTYFKLDEDPAVVARRITKTIAENPVQRLYRRAMQEYSFVRVFETSMLPLVDPSSKQ